MEEIADSDIASDNSQSVGAVEDLKLNEQRGNVIENKGSRFENRKRSGNPVEKKGSYAFKAGMSLKRKAVGGVQRC
jgi:sporulation protein YlmC with PRC-barrel domain